MSGETAGQFLVDIAPYAAAAYAVFKSKLANQRSKDALEIAIKCSYPQCGHVCNSDTDGNKPVQVSPKFPAMVTE